MKIKKRDFKSKISKKNHKHFFLVFFFFSTKQLNKLILFFLHFCFSFYSFEKRDFFILYLLLSKKCPFFCQKKIKEVLILKVLFFKIKLSLFFSFILFLNAEPEISQVELDVGSVVGLPLGVVGGAVWVVFAVLVGAADGNQHLVVLEVV